jgi:hypothetical protein
MSSAVTASAAPTSGDGPFADAVGVLDDAGSTPSPSASRPASRSETGVSVRGCTSSPTPAVVRAVAKPQSSSRAAWSGPESG